MGPSLMPDKVSQVLHYQQPGFLCYCHQKKDSILWTSILRIGQTSILILSTAKQSIQLTMLLSNIYQTYDNTLCYRTEHMLQCNQQSIKHSSIHHYMHHIPSSYFLLHHILNSKSFCYIILKIKNKKTLFSIQNTLYNIF